MILKRPSSFDKINASINPSSILLVARIDGSIATLLGTAFCVGKNKLATAAHVSTQSDKNLAILGPVINSFGEYQDTTNKNAKPFPVKIAAYDPVRDISIIEFSGESFHKYSIGSSDDVEVGDPVTLIGYPHCNDGRRILTRQDASIGARILLGARGIKSKNIVLNTQARPGQSGSPVFTRDGSRVIAMLVGSYAPAIEGGEINGVNPLTLHQTTHAVSAEYIRNML